MPAGEVRPAAPRILVIGGASLDRLGGSEERVAGGAGLYTALAASRLGGDVTLYSPRPRPVPKPLQAAATRLTWIGPDVSAGELPHFTIAYRDGDADYEQADFNAEARLTPAELPDDLSEFDCVHLVPLGDIDRQLAFAATCRDRGAGRLSAGTAADLIEARPGAAQRLLAMTDFLFMNEAEAVLLFGDPGAARARPGQVLFVTRGSAGAAVIMGVQVSSVPAVATNAVDPTGAGDTFCGATLVGIARGEHPALAVRHATALAAAVTRATGPAALLEDSPVPAPEMDGRVIVNSARVQQVADLIDALPDVAAFDFTGDDLPPAGHAATLDYFFATTAQQFGFWSTESGRYAAPLIAAVDGEARKGAFYLFRAWLRWLRDDPARLTPAGQATLTRDDLADVMRADDGSAPLPALEQHLATARRYGEDMLALGLTPGSLVAAANASASPVGSLLSSLDRIGGYNEDPLRKKSALLAAVLQQRPEKFLGGDAADIPPIVDYHLMRSCLRIGLVDVVDATLAARLEGREVLTEEDEWAVRIAAWRAVRALADSCRRSMGAIDWFFFQSRRRCPEMSEPVCSDCPVDPCCAHRKEMFQPVYRTTFY